MCGVEPLERMICPICKHEFSELRGSEASFSPFCSDRCRLIDLGRWLSGRYQIPVLDDNESHDGEVDAPPASR